MEILFWHWLVFGMVLIIAEIFIPSFTIFWFGLAGIVVSGFLWFSPAMSLSWQLFIWAVASVAFTFLWFRFFKPLMIDRTKAGISREAVVGEIGHVIQAPQEGKRGMVRFTTPLLGDDEWPFICHQQVAVGDRVVVRDISGNTLIVEKQNSLSS
ncbi:MAG: NfeD family protein [Desulfobacterales bacterium]|jgi:membrane protein implicated in regulation of membrane protease activity|nr:NfeD family protein [Desulfobacterales bacterium]MDD3082087.1 NfeD family protein [Desulfobacterales bacterium]MDD3950338.1 NfeD family protein [Desulfobacterales bacterium]MDD4462820.1 NfeD family protein [Desulfobacterales bacterium]MDY0378657.1 NfeD family protein [Desulfobacterales bacterium]